MSGIIGVGSKSGIIGETELDYEEGTWSPYITTNGSAYTTTGRGTTGYYRKIGKMVIAFGNPSITTPTGGSETAVITGLPYSVRSTGSGGFTTSTIAFGRIGLGHTGLVEAFGQTQPGETTIWLYYNKSGVGVQVMPHSSFHYTTPYMSFTLTYFTD